MASDPNNTRWSSDDTRFGHSLMKKQGWTEGKGIGKDGSGAAEHVAVSRKDDVLGIGYQANVSQTWSTQAQGFAGLLGRLNKQATPEPQADADGGGGSDGEGGGTAVSAGAVAGKHGGAYAKRRRLKTEGLTSAEGQAEILGYAAIRKRPREDDDEAAAAAAAATASTLRSESLQRACVRVAAHEKGMRGESLVTITKPDPRPAKATATPFRA